MSRHGETRQNFDSVKVGRPRNPLPDVALRELATLRFKTRFYAKVAHADNGCHVWTACVNSSGYGMISVGSYHSICAHRAAWILHSGEPIPPHHDVDHLCGNKRCVNPQHLEVVTHSINMQRRSSVPSLVPTHPPTLRVRHYPTRTDPIYQVLWREVADEKIKQRGRTFPSRRMAEEFMGDLMKGSSQ